jgi:hypothetical protein
VNGYGQIVPGHKVLGERTKEENKKLFNMHEAAPKRSNNPIVTF